MLSSVEGQAYVNFRSWDEGRNRTPVQILKEMDSIYNVSVTFRDLNARMCGLKQGMKEPIKTYYERMADISVKLEQYHGDRFGPGELKMMKKDCFYAGLKEHNKYLVSHMKDREQYGPAQMLKEIREQEDSCYLANTSPKPHHTDSGNKNTSHYNCTVSLSLFADLERILRRFYIFAEEPCKSTITTSEPCSPVFKEAQPRPSNHKQSISLISQI